MKILLDTCVWGGAKQQLIAMGHDVVWAGDWPEDPGDAEILDRARADERVMITLDKDFGELEIVHGKPHRGIVRLVNISAHRQAEVCDHVLGLHADELSAGAVITAAPGHLRIRPPDAR
jgi:predicted nuclease of predicted toxin-antitoxin system